MVTPAPPEVVLTGGDDASGLAAMLADLLRDNLADFPGRARVAARLRGPVVLRAADHDLAVTISFDGDRIEIRDGATEGAAVVEGEWLAMAKLCSGQLAPWTALRAGEMAVRRGRPLHAAAGAGYVLSVPASFYAEAEGTSPGRVADRPAARLLVGAGALLVVLVALRWRAARRGGRTVSLPVPTTGSRATGP
jgi:hypothetical protein